MEITENHKRLLQVLNKWQGIRHAYNLYVFHDLRLYDEFEPFEYKDNWFGFDTEKKIPGHEFLQFASDITGGVFALWQYPELEGEPPVIFMGSEGEVSMLAPSFTDFLCLLSDKGVMDHEIDDKLDWYLIHDFQYSDAIEDLNAFKVVKEIKAAIQKELVVFRKKISKIDECRNVKDILLDFEKHPNFEQWIGAVREEFRAEIKWSFEEETKSLDLSDQELTEIPRSILDDLDIESIDLSNNQITEIPDFFKELTKLKDIDLSFNELVEIPSFIAEFPHLQYLQLADNELKKVSLDFTKLTELYTLDIEDNPIALSGLDESLFKNKSIQIFHYGNTKIKEEVSPLEIILKFDSLGILNDVEDEEYNELHRDSLSTDNIELIEKIFEKRIRLYPSSQTYFDFAYFYKYKMKANFEKAESLYEKCIALKDDDEFEAHFYTEFARLYYDILERDYDKAEKLYKLGIKADPDCEYCLDRYASFLTYHKSDYKKAEKIYKKLIDLDPDDLSYYEDYYNLAGYWEKPKKQLKIVKQLMKLEPYRRKWKKKYGELLYQEFDEYKKAAKVFKKVLKEKKSADNYWNYLTALELADADQDLILGVYQKALAKYPNNEMLNESFSTYQLQSGNIDFLQTRILDQKASVGEYREYVKHLMESKKLDKAIEIANIGVDKFPEEKWMAVTQTTVLEQKKVDFNLLNDLLNKYISKFEKPDPFYRAKVRWFLAHNRPKEEIVSAIDKAIEHTDDLSLKKKFTILRDVRLSEGNESDYDDIVASAKGDIDELSLLIMDAFKEKDYTKAFVLVKAMEQIDPYHEEMLKVYSGLLMITQNIDAALEFLVQKLDKKNPHINVFYILIETLYRTQKDDEAEKYIQLAYKHFPEDETIKAYMVDLGMLEDDSKSIEELEALVKQNPDNIEYLTDLSLTLFDEGEIEKAIKYFKKLIKLEPDNLLHYLNTGLGYWVLENDKKEAKYFTQALEKNALSTLSFFVNRRDIENYKKYAPQAKEMFPDDERLVTWIEGMDAVF